MIQTSLIVSFFMSSMVQASSSLIGEVLNIRAVAKAKMNVSEQKGFENIVQSSHLWVIEKRSRRNLNQTLSSQWFEVQLADRKVEFVVTQEEKDPCGSIILNAVNTAPSIQVIGAEKMSLTLIDHRNRECKDDTIAGWELVLSNGTEEVELERLSAQGIPTPVKVFQTGDPAQTP